MPLKSFQVKSSAAPEDREAIRQKVWWSYQVWQVDARVDNCKTGGMNRRGASLRGPAHTGGWVITWDRCLADLFLGASADVLPLHALKATGRGEAGRNNYPGKWVSRCGEHGLNSPGGGMKGEGGGSCRLKEPIATFKWAQRLRFFFFSLFSFAIRLACERGS